MAKDLSITDRFTFGKHCGEMVGTVIEEDNQYIAWALEKNLIHLDEDALKYHEEQE